jgi:rare lipoprotein A
MLKHFIAAVALAAGCCSFMTAEVAAGGNECGKASWYSLPGKSTASGEKMNPNAMTAAHKTLPLGTMVRVIDQASGRSIQVKINDRGPYIKGRIIDLTHAAAQQLGFIPAGTAKVCIIRI